MPKSLEKRYGVSISLILAMDHEPDVDGGPIEAQGLVLPTIRQNDARLSSYGWHPTI